MNHLLLFGERYGPNVDRLLRRYAWRRVRFQGGLALPSKVHYKSRKEPKDAIPRNTLTRQTEDRFVVQFKGLAQQFKLNNEPFDFTPTPETGLLWCVCALDHIAKRLFAPQTPPSRKSPPVHQRCQICSMAPRPRGGKCPNTCRIKTLLHLRSASGLAIIAVSHTHKIELATVTFGTLIGRRDLSFIVIISSRVRLELWLFALF